MSVFRKNEFAKLILLGLFLIFTGCTKTFEIRPVTPPHNVYAAATQDEPKTLGLTDARMGNSKPLSAGTLKVVFVGIGDEMTYLGENITRVLNSEGINTTYSPGGNADVKLNVLNYRFRNLRTSGFSPYHTYATFSADLIRNGQRRRITSYFKNSKVPVWAFREVERPCYQIPMEVMVKEIAAKLNAQVYQRTTTTDEVNRLAKSINPNADADAASEQYLKVLELGYTNNPAAIEPLVRLTSHKETIMREAAISALGILGAKDQFVLLKTIFETKDGIDKSMALKSIGDLDTQQAREFMRNVKQSEEYMDDEEIREVAELYP